MKERPGPPFYRSRDTLSLTHHIDGFRIDGFREEGARGIRGVGHASGLRDVLHQLVEGGSLDLLVLEVGEGVQVEVKDDAALSQLLNKQFLTTSRASV